MQISAEKLENNIIRVVLAGRMDIQGAQSIDLKFTSLTATHRALVLVDLTGVEFMASIGLRTLITSAKALTLRGGHLVLFNPQPNVSQVLNTSGVSSLIPVFDDLSEAIQKLVILESD